MGNKVGRVFEGIATLGLSELVRALTPAQKRQVDNSQAIVEQHRQELAEERKKHEERMAQHTAAAQKAHAELVQKQKELEDARKDITKSKDDLKKIEDEKKIEEENVEQLKKLSQGDVASFNAAQEFHYSQQLKAVEQLPDVEKSEKRSCAFLGRTSTGKSTTINALFGTSCKTSPLRCTTDIHPVKETETLQVFDVFGENDEESYHNMTTLTLAKSLHMIVIVYTESVDSVLKLARLAKALKVDKVYVRNKSEDLTAAEIIMVEKHDKEKLAEVTGESKPVVLISAKSRMGLDELKAILG